MSFILSLMIIIPILGSAITYLVMRRDRNAGIAVTLAESTFAKGIGVSVNLKAQGLPPEFVLFGEDASRILISCDQSNLARIKQLAAEYHLSADEIGETVHRQVEIRLDGRAVISATTSELHDSYEGALEAALRTDAEVTPAM